MVDLKSGTSAAAHERPDVYILPSAVVFNHVKPDFSRFRFWMYEDERQRYLERWDLVEVALGATV